MGFLFSFYSPINARLFKIIAVSFSFYFYKRRRADAVTAVTIRCTRFPGYIITYYHRPVHSIHPVYYNLTIYHNPSRNAYSRIWVIRFLFLVSFHQQTFATLFTKIYKILFVLHIL